MGIKLKSIEEIGIMEKAGSIASAALKEALKHVREGVTTLSLNNIAEDKILSLGATPGFKLVPDYDFTSCININEGLVHGIPNDYKVKNGDLVSIDLGAYYKGFHSDLSYTIEVGSSKEDKFLNVGKKSVEDSIKKCVLGNSIGDVSSTMQAIVENAGYSVSRDLSGHGVGRELHEEPYVPCYGKKGHGLSLTAGMVFAVEIIYQKGDPEISILDDDWTIVTADGSLAGLFEKTIAITKNGPKILTNF